MTRNRHNRARAVTHQHEVADPDRHLVASDGMDRVDTGGHAALFHLFHRRFGGAGVLALFDKCGELRVIGRRGSRHRMLRRHGHIGHTHHRIGTRGVDADALIVFQFEVKLDTLRPTNPVALHGAHGIRPTFEIVDFVQQLFSVVGDLKEPLRDLATLHQRARAPAATFRVNLLIGENGLFNRVPVDHGHFLIGQALLDQRGEKPLFPLVVFRATGRELAGPVIAKAEIDQLLFHVADVFVSPFGRCDVVLDGGIFGRQTEGVPAHRLHDIEALHALVARDHIADGVVAHMADMQLAAGVREHRQAVIFRFAGVFDDFEDFVIGPIVAGVFFNLLKIVVFLHGNLRLGRSVKRAIVPQPPVLLHNLPAPQTARWIAALITSRTMEI